MNTFQILLGSNTEATENMAEACKRLTTVFPSEIQFSKILESVAVNKAGEYSQNSGTYLNALCLAHSAMSMDSVQSILKGMESDMGRKRGPEALKSVVIDMDLVVWNDVIVRPWEVVQPFYVACLKSFHSTAGLAGHSDLGTKSFGNGMS